MYLYARSREAPGDTRDPTRASWSSVDLVDLHMHNKIRLWRERHIGACLRQLLEVIDHHFYFLHVHFMVQEGFGEDALGVRSQISDKRGCARVQTLSR